MALGLRKTIEEAAHWFQLAAEKGDSAAQFRLGELLVKDLIDGEKKLQEGKEWLRKAAAQQHEEAITLLASLK